MKRKLLFLIGKRSDRLELPDGKRRFAGSAGGLVRSADGMLAGDEFCDRTSVTESNGERVGLPDGGVNRKVAF